MAQTLLAKLLLVVAEEGAYETGSWRPVFTSSVASTDTDLGFASALDHKYGISAVQVKSADFGKLDSLYWNLYVANSSWQYINGFGSANTGNILQIGNLPFRADDLTDTGDDYTTI